MSYFALILWRNSTIGGEPGKDGFFFAIAHCTFTYEGISSKDTQNENPKSFMQDWSSSFALPGSWMYVWSSRKRMYLWIGVELPVLIKRQQQQQQQQK